MEIFDYKVYIRIVPCVLVRAFTVSSASQGSHGRGGGASWVAGPQGKIPTLDKTTDHEKDNKTGKLDPQRFK